VIPVLRVRRNFKAGETILTQDKPSDGIAFFIRRGRVGIFKHCAFGKVQVATLGANDLLGEMALIDDKPRSATAVALDDVTADVVRKSELEDWIAHSPERTRAMLINLLKRLRAANQELLIRAMSFTS
jgi:CRP-like cAMP-binding protein